jgi:hypothetical protein
LFQAIGDERIEVGAGDGNPTVFGAFDFEVLEDWECAAFADDFAESGECRFQFGNW